MPRVYQGCNIGAQEQEARQISLWLVIILAGACQSNNRGLALTPESRAGEGWGGTKRQSGIREDFNNFNTHVGFPLNCQSRQEYSQQYTGRDLVSGDKMCVTSLLSAHNAYLGIWSSEWISHGPHILISSLSDIESCWVECTSCRHPTLSRKKLICNQNCTKQFSA